MWTVLVVTVLVAAMPLQCCALRGMLARVAGTGVQTRGTTAVVHGGCCGAHAQAAADHRLDDEQVPGEQDRDSERGERDEHGPCVCGQRVSGSAQAEWAGAMTRLAALPLMLAVVGDGCVEDGGGVGRGWCVGDDDAVPAATLVRLSCALMI